MPGRNPPSTYLKTYTIFLKMTTGLWKRIFKKKSRRANFERLQALEALLLHPKELVAKCVARELTPFTPLH
jgi:hypothetical protein